MQYSKLNKILLVCLLLVLKAITGQAQELINTVDLEKLSNTSYKVRYKLNELKDQELTSVSLKIYRRRQGKVEEIFSEEITKPGTRLNPGQTYSYTWNTSTSVVKDGDELQARIFVSYTKPPVVKVDPNKPPKANAGPDIAIQLPLNLVVILDGMLSYDEDGKIVSLAWRQVSGPSIMKISSPASYKSYVVGEFKPGYYLFELAVTDDKGAKSSDTVSITAKAPPVVQTQPTPDSAVTKRPPPVQLRVAPRVSMPEMKGGPSNALLSLVLPGVGHYFVSGDQYGNDRKTSVFLITALYAGSVGGAIYYKLRSDNEYDKYLELSKFREYQYDGDGNIIGVRGANQATSSQYLSDARNSHKNFLILTGVSAGIMIGDAVYTFIRGSKNKKAWEEEARGSTRLFFSSNGTNLMAGIRVKL